MEWFILIIAGVLIWSFKNVIDKIYLSKIDVNPSVLTSIMLFFNFCYISVFPLFFPVNMDLNVIWPALVVGFVSFLGFLGYTHTIDKDEVSRSFAITQISPLFVIIFEIVLLAEVLKITNYIGIILLVIAALILSVKDFRGFKLSPAAKIAFVTSIVFACYSTGVRYLTPFLNSWTILFWTSLTAMLSSLVFFVKKKNRENLKGFFSIGKKKIGIYIFSVSFSVFGRLMYIMAIGLVAASLVAGVATLQPLFVLILTVIVSLLFPKILKEDISKGGLVNKLAGIILIIIGTLLVI